MLHLFPQMANTAPQSPSKRAPCPGFSAVSVFTSSLGCETASSGKDPAVGLPKERKSCLLGLQTASSPWLGSRPSYRPLTSELRDVRPGEAGLSRVSPLRTRTWNALQERARRQSTRS